ncbi:hypothetical protein HK405_002939 [Cladochytrium tenue]|nr:hypothetical protein HK405_002939 [Cladochytrium tenue]
MKDENASLAHYGIRSGSKILMMGDFQIDAILRDIDSLAGPLIAAYTSSAEAFLSGGSGGSGYHQQHPAAGLNAHADKPPERRLKEEHARIAELLLQALMKVDSVDIPDGADRARARRKEAVRSLNRRLEEVDATRDRVLERTRL